MSTYARKLEIKYGSFSMGGSTGYDIDGFTVFSQEFERSVFTFTITFVSSSAADFADKCKKIEDELRKPAQDLEVRSNGQEVLSYKQSENTGFDCLPTLTRNANTKNTGYSRSYNVSLPFGRPAIWERSETVGLRSRTVSVSADASGRRAVSISGEFTAVRENDGKAQYEARVEDLCTAVLAYIDSNVNTYCDKVADGFNLSTNNKTCSFSRTYRENLYDQGSSALSADAIVDQTLVINRSEDAMAYSPSFVNPIMLSVSYNANIDKTKKSGNDLEDFWESDIRDWLINTAKEFIPTAISIHVIKDNPVFDVDNNTISAQMLIMAFSAPTSAETGTTSSDGNRISMTITSTDSNSSGMIAIPVYTGDPLDFYVFQGPSIIMRNASKTLRVLDTKSKTSLPSEYTTRNPVGGDSGGDWVVLNVSHTKTPLKIGIGKDTIEMTDLNITMVMQYVKQVQSSGYGSGGIGSGAGGSGGGGAGGGGGGGSGAGLPGGNTGAGGTIFTPGGEYPGSNWIQRGAGNLQLPGEAPASWY